MGEEVQRDMASRGSHDHLCGDAGPVARTAGQRSPEEQLRLIRDRIPMAFLMADSRFRLVERVRRAEAALEPFATAAVRIAPDLSDDTPVELKLGDRTIYTLALGSLRAARQAIQLATGGEDE